MKTKTIGNKYPCCRKPTGLHHDHWADDAVLEKSCPMCGTPWIITFENVQPFPSMPPFRQVKFQKKEVDSESRLRRSGADEMAT